jgi:putative SOS response-associated peptidase YedK
MHLYHLDADAAAIGRALRADAGQDPWSGGHISPLNPAPVVVSNGRAGAARYVKPRLWGVPPPPAGNSPITSVRNLKSPFWIGTLRHPELRCLVPATSFSIWSSVSGQKRQHKVRVDGPPIFAFAAIMRQTEDWPSFAILHGEPNRLLSHYQSAAMPIIIGAQDYERWLSAEWREASALVQPWPAQYMVVD